MSTAQTATIGCLVAGALCVCGTTTTAAESDAPRLDTRSRQAMTAISVSMRKAGEQFNAGRFEDSARSLERAMNQVEVAVRAGSPELYDALLPKMQRIVDARVLIELEGISISPFQPPPRPENQSVAANTAMPAATGTSNANTVPPTVNPFSTENTGVSFVKNVAPILVSKCGGCHIRGSRGGFSLATFAELMKGPPEGVVIFAGDTIGSRLIETIKTGDMPRGGGKVSPIELATLERWINEGAKFDGEDASVQLTSLTADTNDPGTPNPASTPAAPMPRAGTPTGKETVDFASQIAPVLVANCTGCHINAMQARGGLQMDNLARLFRGGDTGPVIQPGRGEASLLVKKLRGTEGARMPAGGRPPLKDEEIALISQWIEEGATVATNLREESLTAMTQKAWLAAATDAEVTARRAELAMRDFSLAGGKTDKLSHHQSDHFSLWGDVPESTLTIVANQAEAALQKASIILPAKELAAGGAAAEAFFNGRASIYVMPRRYDYSEFAQMVERRSLPSDWESHWSYNGLEAYVAVVASAGDDEETIASRLAAPVASLAVRSRGDTVPRWFADGLGKVVAASDTKRDRAELARMQSELVTAVGSLKSGKDFFAGRLAPERADLLSAAVCESFLTRQRKRGFDTIIRHLRDGKKFDDAFLSGMGVTPTAYFDAWLQWVK
ncbi:c-type cytochrome domain-containing protein [Rhodopirellula sallentina]|uniref:Cytochrome C n=1 Tax=Rhodopirellula sallentina SM41 TaxID=1263870 RepID=M5U999_9BACT|nr:c-type cytochrome domain-containing protein [Rhodopirellula sallentina]EMI57854.1 cytochrome C [Rhodopirellula sallentina SM41]